MIRQPIVTVVGHIDHGKTTILDKIRRSAVTASEAGGITQCISCSAIPLETVKRMCGPLLSLSKTNLTIPGLLFIDTPGHAAFSNLRKRGGNLADIAVVVVDVNEGFKPQTHEAIEILKSYKTPFVVAANKIDLVPGWSQKDSLLLKSISLQSGNVRAELDKRIYTLVGSLSELGFNSERFDRVEDFTKQVAIVPVSARTGEGIPELLMVLAGLAQRFLEENLRTDEEGFARGTVLEVKEEQGLGKTLDVIVYEGRLRVNDTIVIGGIERPVVTKVRALLEPPIKASLHERQPRFRNVREVRAAAGVKIVAPDIKDVVAGMPFVATTPEEAGRASESVQREVEEVILETDSEGIVAKADTLGSLEALMILLRDKGIPVSSAGVGNITKKDVSEAEASGEKEPLHSLVVGFNVGVAPGVSSTKVKMLTSNVIYDLIDKIEKWMEEEKKRLEEREFASLVRPCKIEVLQGYVFRQSNPAIVGVEVLQGTLKAGTPVMNQQGRRISVVKSIQHEQESVSAAERGKQVAVALPQVTVGRQLHEGDILYSDIPEEDFRKLKQFKKYLSPDEVEAVKEIARIKRRENPVWGV